MGECDFNLDSLEYRGTPVEQAKCLMRSLDQTRNLGPPLDSLPDALASRIGRDSGLPSRETLSAYLSKQDLEWDFAAHLWQPVSRAEDNNPQAPAARYFVIHDTSGPNYGHRSFPDDIDSTAKFNNLKNYYCPDGWGKAHVVVNRSGDMIVDHDFRNSMARDKIRARGGFRRHLEGAVPARRDDPTAAQRARIQPP